MFKTIFNYTLIASTIRLSTPLILAALGGLYSERGGVINIALEGMMLAGAFTAAVVTVFTQNPWIGLLSAVIAGVLVAALHALQAAIDARGDRPFPQADLGLDGPAEAMLGQVDAEGMPVHHEWKDPVSDNPQVGDTEVWEFHNFTADAHPMHVHEVAFEVVNRQALVTNEDGETEPPSRLVGDPRPRESWESGFKDTVIAYPGEVTRIRAKFSNPGQFVWHCHIVEHEDNEMMRPYRIGPVQPGQPGEEDT